MSLFDIIVLRLLWNCACWCNAVVYVTTGNIEFEGAEPHDMGSGFCPCFTSQSPGVTTKKTARVRQCCI